MADGMIEKYFKNEPATLGFKKGNILHRAAQAKVQGRKWGEGRVRRVSVREKGRGGGQTEEKK